MKIQVKLFALARQLAESDSIVVELSQGASVSELRRAIGQQYPDLINMARHAMFAVGKQYADNETLVSDDSEVACIPPVSGG